MVGNTKTSTDNRGFNFGKTQSQERTDGLGNLVGDTAMTKKKFKLTIELIPSTVWFSSLYQFYKRNKRGNKWRRIKNKLYDLEGRRCFLCGKEGSRLEAHEFWEYDDKNHIQKLVAIHHLCSMCHKIKHIGFWCHTEDGRKKLAKYSLTREDLIVHFCEVNNCSKEEFEKHEEEAFEVWRERSKHEWSQDFRDYDVP